MSDSIGFIGLGKMGEPMARNLLAAGHQVRVFNRTSGKGAALVEAGARSADTPASTVEKGGIVVTMVANDRALEEVTLGRDGFAEALGRGGLHISMSTVSPATSRRLAEEHRAKGSLYVAAPVFGRPDAASAKRLWICVSGPAQGRERAKPVLEAMGQKVYDYGDDAGAANVVKLAGNFLIVSALEAMAEAYALAEKNGIDRSTIATMFGETMFASPIYQNYGRMIAQESYTPAGFKLSLGLKDVNLVLDAADASGVPMPFASAVHDRLLTALAKGRGDMDWTAVGLGVSEDAGLKGSGAA